MLKTIIRICELRPSVQFCRLITSQTNKIENDLASAKDIEVIDTRISSNDESLQPKNPEDTILDKCQEDISHVAPFLKPSFNFAAYVNKSHTLQQFIKLGVNLHKLEKKEDVPPYLLQLDFDRDIKNHIIFLTDLGLQTEDLAKLVEQNPFIFKEDLNNLQIRINYLKSKKFSDKMILRIVQDDPKWLSISTQEIDAKLGFFQKTFFLSGNEVRSLAIKKPKLITYNINHIKLNFFVIKEEMGFDSDQLKHIILDTPKLFMKNQNTILKTFEYIHKEMNLPLETIAKMPKVLTCREFRIKQRHQFLQTLGKLQFDPKKPNYISLLSIISGTDAHFATEVAGSSIHAFNAFLKTL